jgi:ceramide glucosyltransferase
MFLISVVAAILAGLGALITTLQTGLTLLFRRRRRFFDHGPHVPSGWAGRFRQGVFSRRRHVSILKPVCGLDDELEANLDSFAAIRGVAYEVIVSIADLYDPALPIVERVMARHANVAWKLVVGGDPKLETYNRKVARLIAAMRHAKGDVLLISDSNVRVEPDDVAMTVHAFDDPLVGCVSNLFTGSGARTFGASIESLHLLSFVVPGAVIAAMANIPCVVGKSMAIRRDVLAAVGGFEAFVHVLAEDQAIGLAVRDAGYDVGLSPVVVRNIVVNRTLRRALDRQIRWNKIRYAFSKRTYASEILLFPFAFAALAALFHPAAWPLPVAILALRLLQVAMLARATDAPLGIFELLLVPLFDLLHFGAQFVPYFDDRVTWRGHATRLGPRTVLMDWKDAA